MRPAQFGAAVTAVLLCVAITACSKGLEHDRQAAPSVSAESTVRATATTSPTASAADESAAGGYDAYCAATRAAQVTKDMTVAEDITARRNQADATRALAPMSGVSTEIATGAEVLAQSADEIAALLEQFPPGSAVADIGLDPRITRSAAMTRLATDPNYRAFLAWTIQTCQPTTPTD